VGGKEAWRLGKLTVDYQVNQKLILQMENTIHPFYEHYVQSNYGYKLLDYVNIGSNEIQNNAIKGDCFSMAHLKRPKKLGCVHIVVRHTKLILKHFLFCYRLIKDYKQMGFISHNSLEVVKEENCFFQWLKVQSL
jgi:hypothetical protein